jgi:hypothetical protein
MKTSFNIFLVKVEICIVLKNNIYDNIFWPLYCALTHLMCIIFISIYVRLILDV